MVLTCNGGMVVTQCIESVNNVNEVQTTYSLVCFFEATSLCKVACAVILLVSSFVDHASNFAMFYFLKMVTYSRSQKSIRQQTETESDNGDR